MAMETNVEAELFVGDLDRNVTEDDLCRLFEQIGDVISVELCREEVTYRSLGYGFVNYKNPQHAAKAMEDLNFTPLNGKCIRISYSDPDGSLRSAAANLFVKNLDKEIDSKALHKMFSPFGDILSLKIQTDIFGQSKGYGFVQYRNEEAAQRAIEQLNGMLLNGKKLYVGLFISKQERETRFMNVSLKNLSGLNNLYVENLDDKIDTNKLKELFSQCGTITSCKVMCDHKGISKGSGFVAFSTNEEASKAISEMNGRMVYKKPLYVSVAEKREVRRARLQSLLPTTRTNMILPSVAPGMDTVSSHTPVLSSNMPTYTPGGPGIGQRIFYGHAPPAIPPHRPRFGYKQSLIPNARPNTSLPAITTHMPPVSPHMPMYPPVGPGVGQQIFYGHAPPAILPPMSGFGCEQQFVHWPYGIIPIPNVLLAKTQLWSQGPLKPQPSAWPNKWLQY